MVWHVVYTKRAQEQRALTNLRRQDFECHLPMLLVQQIVRGAVTVVPKPLFPRYLFVRFDAADHTKPWSALRSTKGVKGILTFGSEPAVVRDDIVEALRAREGTEQVRPLFAKGDAVQVTSGPFAGLDAIYQMADGESRALVLIEILSKPTHLPVDLRHVRALTAGAAKAA